MSYDSIMDNESGPYRYGMVEDSLFDKTGHRTSMSSDSGFFGNDSSDPRGNLEAPRQYRPLSSLSIPSVHSPLKEDDTDQCKHVSNGFVLSNLTFLQMLGGGHVRRRSVGSMIEASPCVRVEKRKHIDGEPHFRLKGELDEPYDSPNKARILEAKPSIASTARSFMFGDGRMIRAKHGLLERQSLENTALIAEGEDISTSFRMQPVFTRPAPATRSRSSTCTSSSGAETPSLSISDGYSSFSDGSQLSIDLSQVNHMLSNATHPLSNAALD
ncbi:hypothetical protein BV22DRAFT_1127073 [Leucogyrophana mollusca]|uniref:Uncharacterized protein n=1 Tax=Leucogyrophana mollusca TaxID=85980 RepID=A0ACB8BS60_9AGAM|nr:hypothetical protein BV22DRAFT_1127073 [Leucogyrophana mollusca]